jgi:Uma2 family endonuclease
MSALLPMPEVLKNQAGLRLDGGANGMLMSPKEFEAIEDWDKSHRYELIHGVVVVSPAFSTGEADPNEELGLMLRLYRRTHPQGQALDFTVYERDVRIGDDIRRCDRALWIGLGRRPRIKVDLPAIVVEFVSKGKRNFLRDYIDKRREYLSAGVQEYWVINRFTGGMHVFLPPLDENREIVIESTQTYSTPLLPGFELPLAQLLAQATEWDESE